MNFFIGFPLIALIINLFLVFLVLHRDQKSRINQVFSHVLIGLGLWALCTFGLRTSPDTDAAVMWHKVLTAVTPILSALYLHFTILFTGTSVRKWQLPAIYSLSAVFVILALTDLTISGAVKTEYGYIPRWGPLAFLFILTVSIFIFSGLYLIVMFLKKIKSKSEKKAAALITVATSLLIIGGLTGFTHTFKISIIPVSLFANMAFSLIAATAVLKLHLLDRREAMRKVIIYLLYLSLTTVLYIIISYFIRTLFPPSDLYMALNFTALIAVAMGLSPAYRGIEEQVDRWFYHERYDKLKALEKFSLQTYKIDDLDELSSKLVALIGEALQTTNVYLLLISSNGDLITVASNSKDDLQYTIKNNSPLGRWLKLNRLPLNRTNVMNIPLLREMSQNDLAEMDRISAELIVPVVTKQEQLAGLIVLGEKLSREPYSREDERMASLVASNTATELENARLYQLEKTIREEIQRQDAQKTEFLHTIAHELKTPLTAIISSSELLSDEQTIPDNMKNRIVNNIRQSAESMDKRVSELLDLARSQIGVLEIQAEPMMINDLLSEVVSQMIPVFDSKQQVLKLQMPPVLLKVNADRERIKQVLYNLLSNSNKYAPPESETIIRAYNGNDRIVVEVEDSAETIPASEREKIFDSYYRSQDNDKNQKYPGLGLGLSISKKIIELQSGKIWYDPDKNENRNIFAFSLPVFTGREAHRLNKAE